MSLHNLEKKILLALKNKPQQTIDELKDINVSECVSYIWK